MKKTTKFLLGGALVILFLTPVSQVKADWHRDNIGWWYSLDNGSYYKNADAYINWKSYRFNNSGYMVTGWDYHQFLLNNQKKEGWFYYDPVSGEQQTGWKEINGKWYYLSFGGAYTGIRIIDGKWYYLGGYGAYSGQIYTIDRKRYYFDPDSCELKTGWFEFEGSKYYADPNDGGALASDKTLVIDGVSYSFNRDGSLIQN